jgi:AcrR family transcriptional regulator
MGVRERRDRERVETREKIIEAARELFIEEGYEGVSMRQIADKIEYSPTAIYVHFKDKDELFLEICHQDYRMLAHSMSALAQVADPVERLRRIGRGYVQFGLSHPNHYRRMFMTPHAAVTEDAAEQMGKGNPEEDAYELLRATVAEALRGGAFREHLTDVDLISQTLWAGTHGVTSLEIAKGADRWVPWRAIEQRCETMLDGLLDGLLREKR